jgi:hypothetical protein
MLKKRPASALCCAALLLVSAPSAALAQTPKAAAAERNLTVTFPEKRPELKALFAESAARARAGGASHEADFKRFEKLRRQEEAKPPEDGKMSKGMKVLLVVAIVGGVALIVWATANRADNPRPFCENAPSDLNCIP